MGTKIVIGEASLVQLHVLHHDGSQETINTTDEHPFHAADTGEWTRADQLRVGDRLSTIAGTAQLLGVRYTTERVPVYNLSIPDTPTYYVGEYGVWVHNCIIDFAAFAKQAKIQPGKLDYLLGQTDNKSKMGWFANSLGFGVNDKELLAQRILDGLANGKQVGEEITDYGMKMRVSQDVVGANGRTMSFTTVWQIDNGADVPRLVTVSR